jgi:hypothetical protein
VCSQGAELTALLRAPGGIRRQSLIDTTSRTDNWTVVAAISLYDMDAGAIVRDVGDLAATALR